MSLDISKDTFRDKCERVAVREPHAPHLVKATSDSGWLHDAQCPGVATCGASAPHEAHDAAFANPGEASHCEGWPPKATVATFSLPELMRGHAKDLPNTLRYYAVGAALTTGADVIDEHRAEIERLRAENDALRGDIQRIVAAHADAMEQRHG